MKLFNNFMEEYLELNPLHATYIGINDYNNKLINYTDNREKNKYKKFLKKYLGLVKKELKKKTITKKNRHYLDVLKYRIEIDLEDYKYDFDYLPINSLHNSILNWVEYCTGEGVIKLKTIQDFSDFIDRISVYLDIIDGMIEEMKLGIKSGVSHPKIVMEKVVIDLEKVLKNKNYLLPKIKIPKLIEEDYNLYIGELFPLKIKRLINYLKKEYIPKTHEGFGLKSIKGGDNMYNYLVRKKTTLKNPNIPDIHNLGLTEVKRINENINKLCKRFPNLIDVRKSKKKELFFETEEEIFNEFKKLRTEINNNIMPKYFNMDLDVNIKYDIKKIPDFKAGNNTGAYYLRSSYDRKRKGTFYINTSKPNEMLKCNSFSLAIHEGNPGHHYQTNFSNDMKNPLFISYYNDETSFVEGWGLYAEYLGRQHLLEKKNLTEKEAYYLFGSYNFEMLRAVRLVVDTGIHYYNWDYNKCHQYMSKNTELGEKELENEIYRYSLYPGQALAYKIGGLKFKKMKEETNKDIKTFHYDLLRFGASPLWML